MNKNTSIPDKKHSQATESGPERHISPPQADLFWGKSYEEDRRDYEDAMGKLELMVEEDNVREWEKEKHRELAVSAGEPDPYADEIVYENEDAAWEGLWEQSEEPSARDILKREHDEMQRHGICEGSQDQLRMIEDQIQRDLWYAESETDVPSRTSQPKRDGPNIDRD